MCSRVRLAAVATDLHLVQEQRIKAEDTPSAVAQNLCAGIAPQKKVTHHSFAKYKEGHLRVRRVVEQEIQRMLICDFFAGFRATVDGKRQTSDGFSEDAHTA